MGPKFVYKQHMKRAKTEEELAFQQYRYQLRIRKITSEIAPSICLSIDSANLLQAENPLSSHSLLGRPAPLPFSLSIIYGTKDFLYAIDNGASRELVEHRRGVEGQAGQTVLS